jgi:hypothetical protein
MDHGMVATQVDFVGHSQCSMTPGASQAATIGGLLRAGAKTSIEIVTRLIVGPCAPAGSAGFGAS